jgi:hypothetical protein
MDVIVAATLRPVDPFAHTDPSLVRGGTSVISVAVIQDNRLACEGISALLSQLPDVYVVIGACSADIAMLREANAAMFTMM